MSFDGFTIPDGAYLPPELIYLLPNISGAQLKVVLAVLYHNLQVGHSEPVSLSDVERLTGLSRGSVSSALGWLLRQGILEREAVGNTYVYRLVVRFLDSVVQKSYYLEGEERESKLSINLINNNSLSDSLKAEDSTNFEQMWTDSAKIVLLKKLRSAGVYLKTAQQIVKTHDEETIERHLDYYRYALGRNLAQGPGWLVLSLKEGWGPPLGYEKDGGRSRMDKAGRHRYKEWETHDW